MKETLTEQSLGFPLLRFIKLNINISFYYNKVKKIY